MLRGVASALLPPAVPYLLLGLVDFELEAVVLARGCQSSDLWTVVSSANFADCVGAECHQIIVRGKGSRPGTDP